MSDDLKGMFSPTKTQLNDLRKFNNKVHRAIVELRQANMKNGNEYRNPGVNNRAKKILLYYAEQM